jgi:hypothetical protein
VLKKNLPPGPFFCFRAKRAKMSTVYFFIVEYPFVQITAVKKLYLAFSFFMVFLNTTFFKIGMVEKQRKMLVENSLAKFGEIVFIQIENNKKLFLFVLQLHSSSTFYSLIVRLIIG